MMLGFDVSSACSATSGVSSTAIENATRSRTFVLFICGLLLHVVGDGAGFDSRPARLLPDCTQAKNRFKNRWLLGTADQASRKTPRSKSAFPPRLWRFRHALARVRNGVVADHGEEGRCFTRPFSCFCLWLLVSRNYRHSSSASGPSRLLAKQRGESEVL